MFIDHITFAAPDLAPMQAALAAAGFYTDYGGAHSNGITHMALAGFSDGSYLELVSPLKQAGRVMLWHDFALPPEGGTAWTVAAEDVEMELGRARGLGIDGRGPVRMHRQKPDREFGVWDLGYLGAGQPGGTLPFLIHDVTERSVRVEPTAGLDAVAGWSAIVLAVHDRAAAAAQFQRLYGWDTPEDDGEMLFFPGTPVYLAAPVDHLAEFGETPCAAVLRARDPHYLPPFAYSGTSKLAGKSVHWLELPWKQFRMGVETTL